MISFGEVGEFFLASVGTLRIRIRVGVGALNLVKRPGLATTTEIQLVIADTYLPMIQEVEKKSSKKGKEKEKKV